MNNLDRNVRNVRNVGRTAPWAVVFVLAIGALLVVEAGRNLGRWLVEEDPLEKADAILVLSGGMPERALEAGRIYVAGYAREVWLTYSTEPGATLREHGVEYEGEEVYDKRLLLSEGVPEKAVRVLETPILNTADEIRVAGGALQAAQGRRIIIVTSPVHTRRTRTLWKMLARNDGQAVVRGASEEAFDVAHWWRNTRDALSVVREVLGLLNAWAGLPLQPS